MKKSSEVAATWCGRVTAEWLEEPLEMVDSLTGMGFRAAHRDGVCMARTPVQPPQGPCMG